jgi:hypothetical protein
LEHFFQVVGQRLRRISWSPAHALLVIALLELAINEVIVHVLRASGPPVVLDYLALFLFYFTGTLAAFVVGVRCVKAFPSRDLRELLPHIPLAIGALLAAIPILIAQPSELTLPLELAFVATVIVALATVFQPDGDIGAQVGLGVVAIPFLLHACVVLGGKFLWPDNIYDGEGVELQKLGVFSLVLAGLASPYCFAPRPFARAVTRPVPIVIAMAVAAAGAVIARTWYPTVAEVVKHAIGVELDTDRADRWLAIYLLGVATAVWTIASCLIAETKARRQIGLGLALVMLGGYAFKWPHHYLLPMLGVVLIAEAARRVREEELAATPITSDTPPIADTIWSSYVGAVASLLKRSLANVHSLTMRGDLDLTSSLVIGDKDGLGVRTRIERIEGRVLAIDIVVGREVDELRGATLSLWAVPARGTGGNPPPPPANPAFRSGDNAFDHHFRARGSITAFMTLFDEGLRARAAVTLDGWLAYWEGEGLRYRVYPGRGSPLDHPIPISDLALARAATSAERLASVVELLVEIAARGVKAVAPEEPVELDDPVVEPVQAS